MNNEMSKAEKEELLELYGSEIVNNVVDEASMKIASQEYKDLLDKAEFDLDKALDTYDPTFPRYTPSKDSFEFFILMRLVEGKDFEFETPIAHYFVVDMLLGHIKDPMQFPYSKEVCKTIKVNPKRMGIMASRGLAKSTVVISFFAVYSAIKGKLPNGIGKVWFYLLVAASAKGGARVNALAVRAMCEDSKYLNDYFESMRFTETESEFVRKDPTGKVRVKDRSFMIRYTGLNTGIRGIRYGERRPCSIIFDDAILNTAAAYSKVMSDNLKEILYSDATNALKGGGKGRVILCFTPFHYGDVNTKAIMTQAFTPVAIPIARDLDVTQNITKEDIESSWESMHPNEAIADLINDAKKSGTIKQFLQERMLRLASAANRLVPESFIKNQWYDVNTIIKNIDYYNIYITTDLTTTSGEGSDYSGIASWAVGNNGDHFLLNLTLRKRGIEQQHTEILNEAMKWKRLDKHVEIGVEVDGNQQAHLYSLKKLMQERGDYYSFAKQKGQTDSAREGILSKNTGVNKHERFRIATQQAILTNKIWFPEHLKDTPDMKEFISQLEGATHEAFTKSDDGPDLITMLIVSMEILYPTESPADNTQKITGYQRSVFSDYLPNDEEDALNPKNSTIF